jgi:Protein of unknown function (DUF3892)
MMATYIVDRVHKVWSADHSHQHIESVCLIGGGHVSRTRVVASVDAGEEWRTRGRDGSSARIRTRAFCPHPTCYERWYITTDPDHTPANNLDNLPPC